VESALKSLYGVKDVTASIVQSGIGEAEVVYVPAEFSLKDLIACIASASGE
jgi:copper chaperone CopZ